MARWRARTAVAVAGIACVLLAAALVVTVKDHRAQLDLLRNDRAFTDAVDQLGRRDELAVRLGGIHSLAKLMRDSPDDRAAIVAVLCAFIGSHADRKPIPPPADSHADHRPSPPDVVAAFEALAGRPFDSGDLDMGDVYLSLPDAKMPRAQLARATLRGVILTHAELAGARFDNAVLDGANFENADLRGASLRGASLAGADLTFTTLVGADLSGADLVGADLTGAYVDGTDLRRADLTGARATEAELLCAVVDGSTRLPDGVDPVRLGPTSPGCVARKFDNTPQPRPS